MFRRTTVRFLAQPQLKVESIESVKPLNTLESQNSSLQQTISTSSSLPPSVNKLFQHRAMQATTRFLAGPVRNNLLIGRELLRIIVREQQLLPSLQSWPQARQAYTDAFHSLKGKIRLFGVSEAVSQAVREATWGQVGRSLRRLLELGSFYYIGQLVGQFVSFLIN